MKRFYILANPEYFKKTMGWNMKDKEVRYTADKLVAFFADENVPITNIIEPYHCGWQETDMEPDLKSIYEPYCISKEQGEDE